MGLAERVEWTQEPFWSDRDLTLCMEILCHPNDRLIVTPVLLLLLMACLSFSFYFSPLCFSVFSFLSTYFLLLLLTQELNEATSRAWIKFSGKKKHTT